MRRASQRRCAFGVTLFLIALELFRIALLAILQRLQVVFEIVEKAQANPALYSAVSFPKARSASAGLKIGLPFWSGMSRTHQPCWDIE